MAKLCRVDEEGRHPDVRACVGDGARRSHRVQRLIERGLNFSENSIEDIGLEQLFLRDPNGVPIEINCRN